jgi:hypothetical protein
MIDGPGWRRLKSLVNIRRSKKRKKFRSGEEDVALYQCRTKKQQRFEV